MISFIIIGHNEGWKLTRCLQSVYETIGKNNLINAEVIYVDSNSTDDSIENAKKFKEIKIFKLTADINAAIARNLAANKSQGDILFFIDGDMEIQHDFLPLLFNKKKELIHPFISGQYVNYFYDYNNNFIYKETYDNSIGKTDKYKVVTGGLFIIERKCWYLVNGMNNSYKRSQDIDFGLRLARKGIKLLRKKETLAYHHTISYRNNKRMWTMLIKSKSELYGKSLLYRDHLFNKYIYPIIIRNDYSLISLLLFIVLSIIIHPLLSIFYFVIIFARSFKASGFRFFKFLNFIGYFIVRDIMVLIGLIFFFPKKEFNIQYTYVE